MTRPLGDGAAQSAEPLLVQQRRGPLLTRAPAEELPEEAELLRLGRQAASFHSRLRIVPALAAQVLDTDLFEFLMARHEGRWHRILRITAIFLVIGLLPFMYAHTLMPYHCSPRKALVGGKETVVQDTGCDVEDDLRTTRAIRLSFLLLGVGCCLTCVNFYVAHVLHLLSTKRSTGKMYSVAYYHSFWAFKFVDNSYVRKRAPGIAIYNMPLFWLPGIDWLPVSSSVMVTMGLQVVVLQFLLLALQTGQFAVCGVVCYACLETVLVLMEKLLGADADTRHALESEFRGWQLPGKPGSEGMLQSYFAEPWSLCLTVEELRAIASLNDREELQEDTHVPAIFILVPKVYIIDHNLMLNLMDGSRSRLSAEGAKRRSWVARHLTLRPSA